MMVLEKILNKKEEKYWYQLNGKSAQENYINQKQEMREMLAARLSEDDDTLDVIISTKTRI